MAVSAVFLAPSQALSYYMAIALAVFALPTFIVSDRRGRWERRVTAAFPSFIRALAENQRMGMNIMAALRAAGENSGVLRDEVDVAVRLMSYGASFETAFTRFAVRLETPIAYRMAEMVTEAARHGGDMALVFGMAADYAENLVSWERKVSTTASSRTIAVYAAVMVFIAALIMIMRALLPDLQSGSSLFGAGLNAAQLKSLSLQAAVMTSAISGLMIGKFSSNRSFDGLKHSVILSAAALAAFLIFL